MHLIYALTNRTYSIIRGLLTLLFGIVLIIWPALIPMIIVKVIAAFSLAAGLVMIVSLLRNLSFSHDTGMVILNIINIVVYLILGILILLYPNFFISILTFFFGAVLIICGVGQLMNLVFSAKHSTVPSELYVIGVLITLCGIALFFNPFSSLKILMIFFGSILVLYGLSELISAWRLRSVKFSKEGEFISYEEVTNDVQTDEVGHCGGGNSKNGAGVACGESKVDANDSSVNGGESGADDN
jgi:uncharacterized membrane protein HdeD (DUF308 family)